MLWLQIIALIIAVGFLAWSIVSLVRTILQKRKARKKEETSDDRKE